MAMTIQHVRLQRIWRPLKRPFVTSLQEVTERESILVTVQDSEGRSGYGECVAFSTPWYTEETITSCQFVLEHVLIPLVEGKQLDDPRQVADWFQEVKGNRMAKAALENAIWTSRQNVPASRFGNSSVGRGALWQRDRSLLCHKRTWQRQ